MMDVSQKNILRTELNVKSSFIENSIFQLMPQLVSFWARKNRWRVSSDVDLHSKHLLESATPIF